ncbi:galectin-3b [Cebidichthys violaceus]|uniref:galectin-3b n=1 Tax=Cebidichthys violaceus TaxID=271503 RepID=UPI0035C97977
MNLEDALGGWPAGGNNPQQPNPTWPGGESGGVGAWPGQPGQPSQSSWPGQPGQPSQSSWPGQPGQPSQSSWPGQPGQPSQPSWPGEPSQPSQPSQPSWPSPGPQPSAPGGWANPSPGPGPGPGFGLAPKNNMTVPYSLALPRGVHDKLLITIVGTINANPDKITVDMSKPTNDLAFHFNPRFNGGKVIVRNSRIGNKWGQEERECSGFPFVPGQRFEMKIMCTNREFKVAVNNSHLLSYQHRISDLQNIKKVDIYNDLTLIDVRIETLH